MDDMFCLIEVIQDRLQFEAFKTSIDNAGHGFTVAAGEVKELANQTSQATGRFREQVEYIQIQSRDADSSIGKIQSIIEKVNEHSKHVASAMDQQNEATREMSSGAQYANSNMQEDKYLLAMFRGS